MGVRREHAAGPEIELRDGCSDAFQRGPSCEVSVADGAGVAAVGVLRVGGKVVFPRVVGRVGEDVPAVEPGWGLEELLVEGWVGVVVDGEGWDGEGEEGEEGVEMHVGC